MASAEYEKLRSNYRPAEIKWLFVTESPPPPPETGGTRHFYELGVESNDRLYSNTMKALYSEAVSLSEKQLGTDKEQWLRRFADDGCYQIESLEVSLPHGTKTAERHKHISQNLPTLIEKIKALATMDTKVILIKSTVYKMASEPLKAADINVINSDFIDYPGYWREQQFVQKLSSLMKAHGWSHAN
jgi:UDP-glucose 6-dehydrogenase